ncbi:anthranilate synthase component II [Candidatus Puniceispirillum marinum]|uniref:Glutamine amidotransferase of anthranilate synthase n=1 Tax=Puniceispirillum marinum (strain IMCC1322) TaxID=488538 RepID=D5BPJ3_PUNMI|nr:aminodeoxychorismate/anthranilate synthase component II [Candidatus Puniceispirillum marinum]ADE38475.1 Glutamine amidotransferase of anthranilate synthase [Candidatus Puniceispirillum marinum IMCC1322]
MISIIDNYDSFTYIIAQYFAATGMPVEVRKNDVATVQTVIDSAPIGVVLSPGPGRPEDSGNSFDILAAIRGRVPVLGICLGHQIIARSMGVEVTAAARISHGKASAITHHGKGLFTNIKQNTKVGRYHSLSIDKNTINKSLSIVAETADDIAETMAVEDLSAHIYGVQFHPESIMTEDGMTMIKNFVHICRNAKLS